MFCSITPVLQSLDPRRSLEATENKCCLDTFLMLDTENIEVTKFSVPLFTMETFDSPCFSYATD